MKISEPRAPQLSADHIDGFDVLRGVCAFAVAVYHTLAWSNYAHFNGWGQYGVYIFFVLSGASMYVAYSAKFAAGYPADKFIAMRFIRLMPLYALVVLLNLALAIHGYGLTGAEVSRAFLNVFFLFGLGNPASTSNVVGGWSLGIEFIFYLMFPVILAFMKGRGARVTLLITFVCQQLFVNLTLSGHSLTDAWNQYTHFLSFAFYFVAGCFIGRLTVERRLLGCAVSIAVLIISLTPLALINTTSILTGPLGVMLSLCAVMAVFGSAGVRLNGRASRVARYLGDLSYGTYLLHPFVYASLKKGSPSIVIQHPLLSALIVVPISATLALLVHKHFEVRVKSWLLAAMNRQSSNTDQSRSNSIQSSTSAPRP